MFTNNRGGGMSHNQTCTRRTRHSQKRSTQSWLCLSLLALCLLSSHSHQGSCGAIAHATPLSNTHRAPNQLWKRIPQIQEGYDPTGPHSPYVVSTDRNQQLETGNHRRKRHQAGPGEQEARRPVVSKRSLFSGIYDIDETTESQQHQGLGHNQEVVQRLRESWYRRPAVMGEANVLSDDGYLESQGDKYLIHNNDNTNNNTPERYAPDLYDDWVEDENGEEDDEDSTIIEPQYPSLDLFEEDDGDDIGIRDGNMAVDSQIEEEEEERYRRMMSQRRHHQQQNHGGGWMVDEWEEDLETDMDELMDWIEDEDHHVVHDRKPRMQQESRNEGPLQRGYLFPF
ncbi:hypothetical protein MVEG_03563 [Podila verticillata NRRL 6337]|nr:hypothetical protein MVEG_03563 [Podila verticillata NRRL 6337]